MNSKFITNGNQNQSYLRKKSQRKYRLRHYLNFVSVNAIQCKDNGIVVVVIISTVTLCVHCIFQLLALNKIFTPTCRWYL